MKPLTLEEFRNLMKDNYDLPEFSSEKTYFEPLSKIIDFSKVKKVLCLCSEEDDTFELVNVVESLSRHLPIIARFDGFLDGVIVREPCSCFLEKAIIVEILEPGMTSLDIYIMEE